MAGWTGRDHKAILHHISELEMLGVLRPSATPLFYRVAANQLSQQEVIEVMGGATSGEVEPWSSLTRAVFTSLFALLDSTQPVLICLAVIIGLLIHAVMYGPQAAFVTEQFPTRVRSAGSSLAYTLAGIVGGGFAPLIITTFYKGYNSTLAISAYVTLALLITLAAVFAAKETAHKPL